MALTRRAGFPEVQLTCLPASLHNRPQLIPAAVEARIRRARADGFDRIFVAYADCGTGGQLDRVLEAEGVARLEGAHCYEVYAGRAAFAALSEEEPGTFYLTDFLARNFERLVVRGLGLDRHPELLPLYFGNYRRLVFLAQTDDDELARAAGAAAMLLGLEFERRFVGLGEMAPAIESFAVRAAESAGAARHATNAGGASAMAAGSTEVPASNAPKRHGDGGETPESVVFRRSTQDSDAGATGLTGFLHQVQVPDVVAPRSVAYMHPTQADVKTSHSMQDPDAMAHVGARTAGRGATSDPGATGAQRTNAVGPVNHTTNSSAQPAVAA